MVFFYPTFPPRIQGDMHGSPAPPPIFYRFNNLMHFRVRLRYHYGHQLIQEALLGFESILLQVLTTSPTGSRTNIWFPFQGDTPEVPVQHYNSEASSTVARGWGVSALSFCRHLNSSFFALTTCNGSERDGPLASCIHIPAKT